MSKSGCAVGSDRRGDGLDQCAPLGFAPATEGGVGEPAEGSELFAVVVSGIARVEDAAEDGVGVLVAAGGHGGDAAP